MRSKIAGMCQPCMAAGSLQRRLLPAVLNNPDEDTGETTGSQCKPLARVPKGFKWEASSHCKSAKAFSSRFECDVYSPGSSGLSQICLPYLSVGVGLDCVLSVLLCYILLECKACLKQNRFSDLLTVAGYVRRKESNNSQSGKALLRDAGYDKIHANVVVFCV